ncbi:hypothetical protein [Nannocystis punicea]|uniref:Uncharacterized protein n=1 Tax=Nannocystis punicea TaxID=2995304 RepID=A0ABY7H730_9BACT|nr:hypothetical protein [Nannocystis poenicansa]WAS95076.1 hypothetical protein O0S08_02850 [Nannocystis poenicansa]
MKKAVTTVEEFTRALAQLEDDWRLVEHIERAGHVEPEVIAGLSSLGASEPRPVPSRGRGERVLVLVGSAWNEPPFGDEADPLGALRREVAIWPGVESVGAATLDPQFGVFWSFPVTLRLSQ